MKRTIYVELANKETGRRLGVAGLKLLASSTMLAAIPLDRYHGDYVRAGTRFGPVETDDPHTSFPVLKVRGDDRMRERVIAAVATRYRVSAIAGHDRKLIGGNRGPRATR